MHIISIINDANADFKYKFVKYFISKHNKHKFYNNLISIN